MKQGSDPGFSFKEQGKVILSGQTISYNIRRSPKAKYLRLEIRPETGLTVIIPSSYSPKKIPDLLHGKEKWISEKLAKHKDLQLTMNNNGLKDGDTVFYLGQEFKLVTIQSNKTGVMINADPNRLVVTVNNDNDAVCSILEQWYRKIAANFIKKRAEKLATRMKINYSRISIRGQKTRWGSCSVQGNLNFNWKLIMAPEPIIDYVITHELAHLMEMNHSKRFWQIVGHYCPNCQESRKWLTEHTPELMTRMRSP